MKINLIYNTKTGNIVQTHTGIESQSQVMDRIYTTGKINNLAILTLDKLPDDVSTFKVDVKSGKLVKSLATETVPFGASTFEAVNEKKYRKIVKDAMKLLK